MDALATVYRAFVDEQHIAYVTDIDSRPRDGDDRVRQRLRYEQGTVREPVRLRPRRRRAAHIYGPLAPPTEADGKLAAFDQTEFVDPARRTASPNAATSTCRRAAPSIAAAGCTSPFTAACRTPTPSATPSIRHAGYNEWAEANDIVVLYPQAAPVLRRLIGMPLEWPNPQGCWDWWGFTGEDFATKSGAQISAVNAMIDRTRRHRRRQWLVGTGIVVCPGKRRVTVRHELAPRAFPTIDHRSIHVPQLRRTAGRPADASGLLG